MKQFKVLGFLLLVTMIQLIPAIIALSADDVLHVQTHTTQMGQASRQGRPLQDSQLVQPSPRELAAISQVITTKPRPKTLTDADMKYLKELLDKPAWYGFERRIIHEIWTEVSGKEWQNTEGAESTRNKTSP